MNTITIYQSNPSRRGEKDKATGFTKEFIIHQGDTEELARAVEFDNCPARYEDGYRIGAKFQQANCILADIDNTHSDNEADWKTHKDVIAALPGVALYHYPSRNNMKPKDGKSPRPKEHYIFPTDSILNVGEYTNLMKSLIEAFPTLKFDPAVKSPAQLNFGVEGAQLTYVGGEMNLSDFIKTIQINNVNITTQGGRNTMKKNKEDIIPQGQRHTTLNQFAVRMLKRYGDTDGKARQVFLEEVAKCSPPLEDSELDNIWSSAVRFYSETIKSDPDYISPDEYRTEETKDQGETQAQILLKLVEQSGADFFHSETNELYVVIPIDEHEEVWPLEGSDFKSWLNRLFYNEIKKPINSNAVNQTLTVLSAKARFDRPDPVTLSIRVAEHDTAFWYDLANSNWQAIKITSNGWGVCSNPPTIFIRYRHQKAQTIPHPGGDITKILQHINLKNNHMLFLCWLVCCFIPEIPHAMPIFYGDKGSAKSTTCTLLKSLIDPSALETLALPTDLRTLVVSLQQHWFIPFDNVSYINNNTSDALCRAITGGGIQQRRLHTNAEDYIFTFKRCLSINGINNVATRADLLDRSLLMELERVSESDRRELAEIITKFETDKPYILGGIFDTLSRAMVIYPTVKLDRLPRMADFARWGYAVGEALGGHGETFLAEYAANRESQNIEAINSDPVATLVIEFMKDRSTWEDLVSELLKMLSETALEHGVNPRTNDFPSQPNALSHRLNIIKSNLESVGITFRKRDSMRGTVITINNANPSPLPPYSHNPSCINTLSNGDNGDDGDENVQF